MPLSNPLAARVSPSPRPPDPMMRHAQAWQHVQGMPRDGIPAKIATMDHVLPILGALAGNPNVTAKDVIKAAAGAAADGKVEPSEAVRFISSMPAEPDKLQNWLKGVYATNLSAIVHMKAAMMQPAQGASQAVPAPVPPQGGMP